MFTIDLKDVDCFFIKTSILLISLINVTKSPSIRLVLVLIYLALLSATVLPRLVSFKISKLPSRINILFIAIGCLYVLAYFRGFVDVNIKAKSVYSMLVFLSLIAFLFVCATRSTDRARVIKYLRSIFFSVHLFIVANLLGYSLGFQNTSTFINDGEFGAAKLLQMLGIIHDRVLFPFSPGLLSFGILAGCSFVLSVVNFFESDKIKHKAMWGLIANLGLLALLLSDSRGAILYSLIIIFVYIIFIRVDINKAVYFVIPFVFFFIILSLISFWVLLNDDLDGISRGVTILSGREIVWYTALIFFSNLNPSMLIGYGFMGHYVSGLSGGYAFLFDKWGTDFPEFATLHNTFLQTLVDIGLVGLGLFVLIIYMSLKKAINISDENRRIGVSAVIFILYMELSGSTDSALTVYSLISFMPFMFLSVILGQASSRKMIGETL